MLEVIISILTYNKVEFTKKCLQSLIETPFFPPYKIIISDNGSTDGTIEYVQNFSKQNGNIELFQNKENLGFSKAHNKIIDLFKQRDIVLMNNDIEVPFNWLFYLYYYVYKEKLGAASPAIKTKTGIDVGAILDSKANGKSLIDDDRQPDWISGSCMYITKATINAIGRLDENFRFYYEDVDYCKRMKNASIKFRCIKDVIIKHHDSVSSTPQQKKILMDESKKYFVKKWGYKI